jgi:hypothetical protein
MRMKIKTRPTRGSAQILKEIISRILNSAMVPRWGNFKNQEQENSSNKGN